MSRSKGGYEIKIDGLLSLDGRKGSDLSRNLAQ
jgi:hypothetical protein